MTTAYSSTPLAKKLGIKEGYIIRLINQPSYYFDLFTDFPENVELSDDAQIKKNLIHYFTLESKELFEVLLDVRNEIEQNGMIWVSWPKKASKIATDITEDVIRDFALANGLVDIKVCAIDSIWSGLKLVIPIKDRLKEL